MYDWFKWNGKVYFGFEKFVHLAKRSSFHAKGQLNNLVVEYLQTLEVMYNLCVLETQKNFDCGSFQPSCITPTHGLSNTDL